MALAARSFCAEVSERVCAVKLFGAQATCVCGRVVWGASKCRYTRGRRSAPGALGSPLAFSLWRLGGRKNDSFRGARVVRSLAAVGGWPEPEVWRVAGLSFKFMSPAKAKARNASERARARAKNKGKSETGKPTKTRGTTLRKHTGTTMDEIRT
eukprot:scaffold6138_cov105-Isochrysis_galbana.AAC.6